MLINFWYYSYNCIHTAIYLIRSGEGWINIVYYPGTMNYICVLRLKNYQNIIIFIFWEWKINEKYTFSIYFPFISACNVSVWTICRLCAPNHGVIRILAQFKIFIFWKYKIENDFPSPDKWDMITAVLFICSRSDRI